MPDCENSGVYWKTPIPRSGSQVTFPVGRAGAPATRTLALSPVQPDPLDRPDRRIRQQGGKMVCEVQGLHDAQEGIERNGLAIGEPVHGAAGDARFGRKLSLAQIAAQPDFVEPFAQRRNDNFT